MALTRAGMLDRSDDAPAAVAGADDERARVTAFLQLLISGVAQGCVYALVALGFVLIYKATETVNFAQGDLMMLGAFSALR